MTRKEFATAIAVLESGVNVSLTAQAAEVWNDVLGDLPLESLQRAVRRYLAEAEYPGMPPIGKIRRLATEDVHGLALTAPEAWAAVLAAVRKHGYYDTAGGMATLDAPTQQALSGVGGFQAVCDCTELGVLSGQFRRAYEATTERHQTMARLPEDARPRIATRNDAPQPAAIRLADCLNVTGEKQHRNARVPAKTSDGGQA